MYTSQMFYRTRNLFCFGANSTGTLQIREYVINPGPRSKGPGLKSDLSGLQKLNVLPFHLKNLFKALSFNWSQSHLLMGIAPWK